MHVQLHGVFFACVLLLYSRESPTVALLLDGHIRRGSGSVVAGCCPVQATVMAEVRLVRFMMTAVAQL